MIADKLCKFDLHLHTNLSCCAPKTTVVESYLPHCKAEDVELLGISNHLYDWGGIERTLQIKQEIDELRNKADIKFLVGCEAEIFYGKEPYLTREMAQNFDYVLLAPSHIFNFRDRYRDFDLSTPDKAREIIVENFKAACKFHFGSDAHEPSMFIGSHARLERAAERAGITRDDLWEFAK